MGKVLNFSTRKNGLEKSSDKVMLLGHSDEFLANA
nr:hypothetical protein [Tanacetum cinerariifolium]